VSPSDEIDSYITELASAVDFDRVGFCPAADLEVNPLVREACAADRCQQYGRNWVCPPACASLDDYSEQFAARERVAVVQTVGVLEDEYDFEGMMAADKLHNQRFLALVEKLRLEHPDDDRFIFLAAGACTICPHCTYPEEPCRFPKKALVSMEASGLVVSEVCEKAALPYYDGPGTVTYSACVVY